MIITEADLPALRRNLAHKKIIFTGGGFDILHCGHLDLLEFARAQGDVLVVGVASGANLRSRKGSGRPVVPEQERMRMIDAFRVVDYAFVREGDNLARSMVHVASLLEPNAMVLYEDMPEDALRTIQLQLPQLNVILCKQPKVGSTSAILEQIRKGGTNG